MSSSMLKHVARCPHIVQYQACDNAMQHQYLITLLSGRMPFCRTQTNTPSISLNNDTNHKQAHAANAIHIHIYI